MDVSGLPPAPLDDKRQPTEALRTWCGLHSLELRLRDEYRMPDEVLIWEIYPPWGGPVALGLYHDLSYTFESLERACRERGWIK